MIGKDDKYIDIIYHIFTHIFIFQGNKLSISMISRNLLFLGFRIGLWHCIYSFGPSYPVTGSLVLGSRTGLQNETQLSTNAGTQFCLGHLLRCK